MNVNTEFISLEELNAELFDMLETEANGRNSTLVRVAYERNPFTRWHWLKVTGTGKKMLKRTRYAGVFKLKSDQGNITYQVQDSLWAAPEVAGFLVKLTPSFKEVRFIEIPYKLRGEFTLTDGSLIPD